MLCEKCHEREAQVKITRVINGVSETHNLCAECAKMFCPTEEISPEEWSKTIFRLLSSAMMKLQQENAGEEEEDIPDASCPTCGKTCREFLESGILGCGDCYEAFLPVVRKSVFRVQGSEHHTGKHMGISEQKLREKASEVRKELTPEEQIQVLEERMNAAVSEEDYAAACTYRDQIRSLRERQDG